MKNKIFFVLFLSFSLAISSCVSKPENKVDSIYVMVYGYDSSEIMGCSVFIDNKNVGKTDVYGRIVIPVKKGKKEISEIRVEKDGYETVTEKTILKAGEVFYFKIGTAEYYADVAENLLDSGNKEEALKMINKAILIKDRKDFKYLKEVIEKESKK